MYQWRNYCGFEYYSSTTSQYFSMSGADEWDVYIHEFAAITFSGLQLINVIVPHELG